MKLLAEEIRESLSLSPEGKIVLAYIEDLAKENREAWHVAAQNERNSLSDKVTCTKCGKVEYPEKISGGSQETKSGICRACIYNSINEIDAERWRKLICFAQHKTIKIWRDGDKTPFIKIGETSHWYTDGDFDILIDSISIVEPNA